MKKSSVIVLIGFLAVLCMPVSHALASDIFSLNFYMKPWPWPEGDVQHITLEDGDQEAGVDDWLTNGWQDIEIPWAPPAPQDPLEITSKQGATATYTLITARNGGAYIWDNIRTTLIGDGNADLMDGHANGTEDADELIDFTVSDIPFDVYDVIIYMGSQLAQFGDGTGTLTFNGVAHDFTLISGAFDGTFAEIVNPDTPGNYFLFTGLKDASFTVVTRGNGFNHSGPTGLQIRKASPELASVVSPESEQVDVLRDTVLNWTPGLYATAHDVYLGETFDTVDTATVPTAAGLAEPSFDPGRLEFGKTYYWRVDEVNGTPDQTVFKGEVWSFQVEPYSLQVSGDTIGVTASSQSNQFSTPQKVIDGSGLDPNAPDLHGMEPGSMWFTASVDLDPWIEFEFDGVKSLDMMKVWNANSAAESAIGWSVKDVEIATSVDGVTWDVLADANQFSRGPASPAYGQYDAIDLAGTPAKFVRFNILSNWGGLIMSYGLSEVQFFEIPVMAREPSPDAGSVDVLPDSVVTWRSGREVAQHTVYVGTDMDAVLDGTAASVTTSTNSLSLSDVGAEVGQAYYWRVDEVNDAEVPAVWAGPVWSLSTVEALVVDDFDGYNNVSPDRPFQTWHDGIGYSADDFFPVAYGGNGTGAAIGHDVWSLSSRYYDGSIMEKLITMEGSDQSMPFYYDNSTASGSETTANIDDLEVGHDWSQSGIQYLTLSFRADSLSEALDTTASFTAGDTVGWYSQDVIAQDGEDAAQNLDVADGESAMMRTTVTGAGTVSFQWKVSSEADWDFLEFYIDGAMQEQISGEVDWQQMTYEITGAGDHVLEWVYVKDGAVSSGQDVGWVDGLQWSGGGLPITAPGNTGQLYAKVNGVRVDYPGSVAGVKWASWQIDLVSLGTNLQNVQTLTIGIDGAGASGLLYLDNFRLESGQ